MINHAYKQRTNSHEIKGFATVAECSYCGKRGHDDRNCWNKHPEKRPTTSSCKSKRVPRSNSIKCWRCGKLGHTKINCDKKNGSNNDGIIATLNENNERNIDCYMTTYIDSASSCHTVMSLNLLEKGTIQRTSKLVRAIDG